MSGEKRNRRAPKKKRKKRKVRLTQRNIEKDPYKKKRLGQHLKRRKTKNERKGKTNIWWRWGSFVWNIKKSKAHFFACYFLSNMARLKSGRFGETSQFFLSKNPTNTHSKIYFLLTFLSLIFTSGNKSLQHPKWLFSSL